MACVEDILVGILYVNIEHHDMAIMSMDIQNFTL